MKIFSLFFIICIISCTPSDSDTTDIFIPDISFVDVNKSYDGDSNMCSAAVAANSIVHAGYAENPDQVYSDILAVQDQESFVHWLIIKYFESYLPEIYPNNLLKYSDDPAEFIEFLYDNLEAGNSVSMNTSLISEYVEVYHTISVYDIIDNFDETYTIRYVNSDDSQVVLINGRIFTDGSDWLMSSIDMYGYTIDFITVLVS